MKKILKIAGIALVAILLILFLTPFLFQDRIKQEVKNMANRTLTSAVNQRPRNRVRGGCAKSVWKNHQDHPDLF